MGVSFFSLSYLSFKTCSFLVSDDDDDECKKCCNDFSGEGGEERNFSHEQVCSITKSIIFGGVCRAPVVTTRTSTKGAASTKQWVVAMLFDGDWCFRNLPVGVVSKVCIPIGGLNCFEHLSKVTSKPLGWS